MENELFEHAPVPKAYFTMALPVVMGMVVNLVYNIVDTFFIARTQNAQLVAGVSLCAPIFTLMIALGDIFGLGGSSLISRLFDSEKPYLSVSIAFATKVTSPRSKALSPNSHLPAFSEQANFSFA